MSSVGPEPVFSAGLSEPEASAAALKVAEDIKSILEFIERSIGTVRVGGIKG